MKKLLMTTVLIVVAVYAFVTLFMYVGQRKFLYHPGESVAAGFEPAAKYGLTGFEDVSFETSDGETLKAWFAAPPSPDAPVFLYMHGNAGTLADRYERFQLFHKEGFGVLAISWRGFGGSTGSPSEQGLLRDAEGAIAYLQAKGIQPSQLIMFGESLGSGVTVQLAAREGLRPAAVVLDSPFLSTLQLAKRRYWFLPVGLLMKDQFRSDLSAPKVNSPAIVLHGTQDRVTPLSHGEALSKLFAGQSKFLRLEGAGHVADLTPFSWGEIKRFLADNGVSPK